ncbi:MULTISPECIES: glutathione S-transferase family protein [unclassified Roseitalea]|uniref:glutathione S-transferase family protein n=1 Tax=unclassified Roseitalea TaxID=2639107 RepID=UPI00273FAE24|nr:MULTISPECIES: glutathione S-transferase family protein [unclassified Roseitalea]
MILYHHPMSASSRFVRLMLSEYGVDVELYEERPWERRPSFLAISPGASLPVLVDQSGYPVVGAFPLAEYLDETRGAMARDRRLMPDYPLARAEVRRLVDWFLVKLESDVTRALVRERVFKLEMPAQSGGGSPNSAALRGARANMRQHMRYLDWLAGTRDWLGAKTISLADLAAAAAISVLDYMGEVPWAEAQHAPDWYSRVKSRPSFRPLLNERVRGLPPVSHYADLDF